MAFEATKLNNAAKDLFNIEVGFWYYLNLNLMYDLEIFNFCKYE